MAAPLEHDEHGIIDAMAKNGSFVDGSHIVYKERKFHGRRYLNKDDHLKQP